MRIYIVPGRYLTLYNYDGMYATLEHLCRIVLNIESHVPLHDRKDKLRAAREHGRADIARFSYSKRRDGPVFSSSCIFGVMQMKVIILLFARVAARRGRLCYIAK